nr:AgmX/PglI C-terminal domain-containing protein [Pseudenhygromyxa sp. WMMC2535]
MPNQQLQPLDIPNKHNKTKNKTKDQDSDYASGTSGSGGTVRLQAAEATGIDAELARRTIRAHLAELRACYEQAHAKGLAGKVSLSLSVDRRGAVSEAAARGFDEQTARCVSEQAKTWSFAVGQRSEIEIFMEFALR